MFKNIFKDYMENKRLDRKYQSIIEDTNNRLSYELAQLTHTFGDLEGFKKMIQESGVLKGIMNDADRQTPFINELKRCLWLFGIDRNSVILLSKVRTYEDLLKVIKEVK